MLLFSMAVVSDSLDGEFDPFPSQLISSVEGLRLRLFVSEVGVEVTAVVAVDNNVVEVVEGVVVGVFVVVVAVEGGAEAAARAVDAVEVAAAAVSLALDVEDDFNLCLSPGCK